MNNSMVIDGQHNSKRLLLIIWIMEHWLGIFIFLFGIYWITPFLAPVFMSLKWTIPAQVIYTFYSTQCHQLAQRSFFLFGPKLMYSPAELPISLSSSEAVNMLAFREFIGNAQLGWKVAWSDRMVSMYGGVWFASIGFALVRRIYHAKSLHTVLFGLLLIPMVVDGITHFLSDLAGGIVGGFRYNNQWLANLTGNVFPNWFYVGDAFGSFNSWMRLITGILFGIGIAWLVFPIFDKVMCESLDDYKRKYPLQVLN